MPISKTATRFSFVQTREENGDLAVLVRLGNPSFQRCTECERREVCLATNSKAQAKVLRENNTLCDTYKEMGNRQDHPEVWHY